MPPARLHDNDLPPFPTLPRRLRQLLPRSAVVSVGAAASGNTRAEE